MEELKITKKRRCEPMPGSSISICDFGGMGLNMPVVSVIMPVYNVEEYISKAVESVLSQTLTDFELILVDDGTPDRSGEICDDYALKDGRVHVIHKENGGAPSARNTAMKIARGKYFYFMDSDDWAEASMLEDMVTLAERHNAQLVVTGFYIDTYYGDGEDEKYTQVQSVDDMVFTDCRRFREQSYRMFDKNLLYTPWNKLFLAEYIMANELFFPGTFWDDFPFNLSVVRDVERVCVSSKRYYHFLRKRQESETAKYRADMYEKREEEHRWMVELYEYWGVFSAETEEFVARRYIERLLGCIENITNDSCTLSKPEKKSRIREMTASPQARSALQKAQPRSFYMRLLLLPLKMKATSLIYMEGCIISRIKRKNVKRFARLKANR